MAWILLFVAGLFEVAWAYYMKQSSGFTRLWPSVITITTMIVSFLLLSLAMRTLPLGTAYTVWTGVGAIGAFTVGVAVLGEPADAMRIATEAMARAATSRWPLYVRQLRQLMRSVEAQFDERRFGFGSFIDLLKFCQREGLVRLERDRQGVVRVWPGPQAPKPGAVPLGELPAADMTASDAVALDANPPLEEVQQRERKADRHDHLLESRNTALADGVPQEPVLQPAAGNLPAPTLQKPAPVVIDLFLGFTVDRKRDGIREGMARTAIHQNNFLPFQLDRCHQQGAFRPGGARWIVGHADQLRIFENGKIEVHRFFGITVEPDERTDLLHIMNL